ncbi:hypothetical protein FRC12_021953, partial [Ceratobasidium sp. 428]
VLELELRIALPGEPARGRRALGGGGASAAGEESGLARVGKDDRHWEEEGYQRHRGRLGFKNAGILRARVLSPAADKIAQADK